MSPPLIDCTPLTSLSPSPGHGLMPWSVIAYLHWLQSPCCFSVVPCTPLIYSWTDSKPFSVPMAQLRSPSNQGPAVYVWRQSLHVTRHQGQGCREGRTQARVQALPGPVQPQVSFCDRGSFSKCLRAWSEVRLRGGGCDKSQAQKAGHTFPFPNIQPSFPTDQRGLSPSHQPGLRTLTCPHPVK